MLLVELDADVRERAARLEPFLVRAIDAIHIVSALTLGPDVRAFVTYDTRQAEAARRAGLVVLAPGHQDD